tara:strand:- start:748 stop:999 length:252 start_codon:yes stop_codon:yes gene_type:complete
MQRTTRSLLEELNNFADRKDRSYLLESRANNVIASAIHLVEMIDNHYTADDAADLKKRLFNAIKTSDPRKFTRGIRRIQNEGK